LHGVDIEARLAHRFQHVPRTPRRDCRRP
jgi:hypothetical protein